MKYFVYKRGLDAAEAPHPTNFFEYHVFLHAQEPPSLTVTLFLPSLDSGRQCLTGLWLCREWWGKREPSRGARLTKKGKATHFSYKIWQGIKVAFLNQCISGFGNNTKYFFFLWRKWNLWKKLFSREHNVKKLCQKIFPFWRGWQESFSWAAPKNI